MFNFMLDFFRKKKQNTRQTTMSTAPGTKIGYAPELIGKLEADHKALLGIFKQMQMAFDTNNYPRVTKKLIQFKKALVDHLLIENVRLYIYLDHSLSVDEANAMLVRGFRSEMNGIAKVVMAFVTKYETIGVDKDLAQTFGKDLSTIGAALVERINREEETLYPLYIPSY